MDKVAKRTIQVKASDLHSDEEERVLQLKDVIPKLDKYWFRYGWLLKLNILLFGSICGQVTLGFDASSMNSLQSLPSWKSYFDSPSGPILGTMSNGLVIGTLISIPLVFWIIDFWGRRKVVILGCAFIVVGAILQGAAQNFGMFTGARIILGIGSSLSSAAAGPLLSETAYPAQRPAVTSLLLASWPLGSFIASMVTWGPYRSSLRFNNWSWRIPSILQSFFPLIQCVIVFFGPESPRWLISKGRDEEARAFFVKYHAGGDEDSALVAFEMAEIKAIIGQENDQVKKSLSGWFQSKQRLKRLLIAVTVPVMVQLCGNALVAYYLVLILDSMGITNPNDQLKINIGITVYSMLWSVTIGINVDRFRRRFMFMAGFLSMCLSFVIWTILSAINQQQDFKNQSINIGIIVMIYLFSGFYHISAPVAMTYVMEICPYQLRAQGATIYLLCGNLAQLFNNYVNPIAMEKIAWRYYIVYCIWLFVQATFVFFVFPETRGLGLEEIAQVFGEDVSRGFIAGEEALNSKIKNDFIDHKAKAEVEMVETIE